jgi:formate hydrogenlyase transcriptional activator
VSASQVQAESSIAQRYEALVRVSQAIGAHSDPDALFCGLAEELGHVVKFDFFSVVVYDETAHEMCWHVLDVSGCPSERPSDIPREEMLAWWVHQNQRPLVVPFVDHETRFPRVVSFLKSHGIQSVCTLPLTTAHRRLGALGFGSRFPQAHSEEEVRFLALVADQVALAIDDAVNLETSRSAREELQRERDRLKLLLDLSNTFASNLELRELLRTVSASVRQVMSCDLVGVALPDPDGVHLRLHAQDFPEGRGFIQEENLIPIDGSPPGEAFRTGKPTTITGEEIARIYPASSPAVAEGIQSGCCMPLVSRDRVLGTMCLGRRNDDPFAADDVDFLSRVAGQVAIAVENALAYRRIAELSDRLAQQKLYLEDEIRSELNFDEIVGRSAALRRVLQQIETVAPTDSTVLIYGETGSGKELIARAIHNLSPRREEAFVKLNCAAIPTGLLESELFGHERGAFTGAVSQRIGRFELGSRGTVFLDEVSEIPLDLQPKLLRVLQEREFERLGSTRTLRTGARLIAATNRDLAAMVEAQTFRMDLFYRLNVFPAEVPPLRERQEDIPMLVRHFVQQFSRRMNKTIDTIPSETMDRLVRYRWPGNVRELQNLIERAVILTPGNILKVPLRDLETRSAAAAPKNDTLDEAQRKHLLAVLEETHWVLAGPNGAAARLGMKRSTLQFRMRKLGITRPAK